MATRRILFSWIGHADLRAMAASLPVEAQKEVLNGISPPTPAHDQSGPLKCLLEHEQFDEVHLLTDHGAAKNRLFVKWLGGKPVLHSVKLANPTDYPEVFGVVDAELASVVKVPRPDRIGDCPGFCAPGKVLAQNCVTGEGFLPTLSPCRVGNSY